MLIGVLGGGQLGRMLALAGYPLGLRFRFLEPTAESPAAQVGERIVGELDDPAALARFRVGLDVVTYEFENVPIETACQLAEQVPVYPPPQALAVAQERAAEKTFFQRVGIPVPPFAVVDSRAELDHALAAIGLPAVIKTRRFGYDGKGQAVVRTPHDVESAWTILGGRPLILERLVAFSREVSLLAVRSRSGAVAFYPLVQNEHSDGMLRVSRPLLDAGLQAQAEGYARRALEALNYVGVLAIEFFVVDGRLLANEMAPRVHNSGHWTIEGAQTSQFANHLRAILGWPLGGTGLVGHAVMVNLIGRMPATAELLSQSAAQVHLYGKTTRPGHKLGHLTFWGFAAEQVEAQFAAWQNNNVPE